MNYEEKISIHTTKQILTLKQDEKKLFEQIKKDEHIQ